MSENMAEKVKRWRLASITVVDFRGVLGSQSYEFNGYPALIWGNNGVGKSTLALALEWTLFGAFPSNAFGAPKDAFMSPVGSSSKACKGEVVFVRDKSRLVIKRDAAANRLTVEIGSKQKVDDEARALLQDQLGLDMDTFVRAILLQQSKIRGLLLDEVKDRNKALDRLLGMDAAETMLDSIKSKPFKDAAKAWREDIEATESHFQSQAEILEKQFNAAQKEARAQKFLGKDLSGAGLTLLYAGLGRDLVKIATKYGAPAPDLPVVDGITGAKKTSTALAKTLIQIRLGAELSKQLAPVEKHLTALEEAVDTWTEIVDERESIQKDLDGIIKLHGASKAVAAKRGELEMEITSLMEQIRSASELRSLLAQARKYFERGDVEACPVCEQDISQPKKIYRNISGRIDGLTTKSVRDLEASLDKIKINYARIGDVGIGLQNTEASLVEAQKQVEAERKRIIKLLTVEGLLEKKVLPELGKAIANIAKQRDGLKKGVETMEKDLNAIGERDRAIREGLVPFLEAREAVEVHELEWKKAKKSYVEAESKATNMDNLATQVENIKKAVLAAKDEIASETLGKAGPRAQGLYQRLVSHPLFDRLDVKTALKASKVDYSFEVSSSLVGKSAREARLVLSDGQMTAAALALFFALAESSQHGLDLLYIDDPTQNLDHSRKEAMAKAVVDLATRKQIVVSTQDEDFVVLLRDAGFENGSVVHHIEEWDRRPTVRTTMPSAA